eukprot:7324419-Heterocapsa_arctica.AAC.1
MHYGEAPAGSGPSAAESMQGGNFYIIGPHRGIRLHGLPLLDEPRRVDGTPERSSQGTEPPLQAEQRWKKMGSAGN